MIRDQETTQIFRKVAKKGWIEHDCDGPNASTYLDDLAGEIIDNGVTTGDELMDSLVAWYGGMLTRLAIDRFDKLDRGLKGMEGQAAMVVSRTKDSMRLPYKVETSYNLGAITGELDCDLMRGDCYIPTEGRLSVSGIHRFARARDAIIVTHVTAGGYDDEPYRFFGTGLPNLARDFYPDGRTKETFVPSEYRTALEAAESRKPHVEVILGTERVRNFLATDETALVRFDNVEFTEQLANILD
jgi:hypothetical protein